MFSEIERMKANYARTIEDGRKMSVFTTMPEWQWYVESVLEPTINDNIEKIMMGRNKSDKEDWIARGIVMGLKMVVETPENFIANASEAGKKAKALQGDIDDGL